MLYFSIQGMLTEALKTYVWSDEDKAMVCVNEPCIDRYVSDLAVLYQERET